MILVHGDIRNIHHINVNDISTWGHQKHRNGYGVYYGCKTWCWQQVYQTISMSDNKYSKYSQSNRKPTSLCIVNIRLAVISLTKPFFHTLACKRLWKYYCNIKQYLNERTLLMGFEITMYTTLQGFCFPFIFWE